MNRQPQATTPLAALPPDERTRALERYRMLQPCVEHDVPLTHVARPHDMPLRTLEQWHARYRRYWLSGSVPSWGARPGPCAPITPRTQSGD
jgi:hypothetical protein